MSKRGVHLTLALALMAFAAGVWRMNFDFNCVTALIGYQGLLLYSDGTATHYNQFLYTQQADFGTWTLSANTLRVFMTDQSNDNLVFLGTFQKNKIVNGRLAINDVGQSDCWTAERVVF